MAACDDPPEVETLKRSESQLIAKTQLIDRKLDGLTEDQHPLPKTHMPISFDDSHILDTFKMHQAQVIRCRDLAEPGLEGRMTVRLVINPDGAPERIRVSPDKFKGSAPGDCMINSIKEWRFSEFSGAAIPIEFPVQFPRRKRPD